MITWDELNKKAGSKSTKSTSKDEKKEFVNNTKKTSVKSDASSGWEAVNLKAKSRQMTLNTEHEQRKAEPAKIQDIAPTKTVFEKSKDKYFPMIKKGVFDVAIPKIKQGISDYTNVVKGASPLKITKQGIVPTTEEERQFTKEARKGMLKNVGELGSGVAKFGLQFSPLSGFAGTRKLIYNVNGKEVQQWIDRNSPEYLKKVDGFIDSNGILNYKPEYANKAQKTGGDIAEIGSWFIPITRAKVVGGLEQAIKDIPEITKTIGTMPKIVSSGGKLFYEASKDAVDVAILDAFRGKDWETIKDDATIAGGAGVVIRGVGVGLGTLIQKLRGIKTIEKSIGQLTEEEKAGTDLLFEQGKTIDDIATDIMIKRERKGFPVVNDTEELITKTDNGVLAGESKMVDSQIIQPAVDKQKSINVPKKAEAMSIKAIEQPIIQGAGKEVRDKTGLEQIIKNRVKVNGIDPLIEEARKYGSAEEFVKSQSLYHGTPNELEGGALKFGAGKQLKKGGYMGGHFLTDTPEIADSFSFGGKIYQASGEIKNKVLDVNKSKKLFQDFVGKKYKSSDGEMVEFTKQEFDYMFPEGKADWATLNDDLVKQIAKKQGKIGVAIPEYAGGKQGMTYQIFEDNIPVKTKQELTDIWNKSQHPHTAEYLPTNADGTITPIDKTTGHSILATKLNERIGKDNALNTEYDIKHINEQLDNAADRLNKDTQGEVANAFKDGGDTVAKVSTLAQMFEKTLASGETQVNKAVFTRLKELSTRTAQTLNMFKALTEVNPHFKYMSDVINTKMQALELKYPKLKKALEGKTDSEKMSVIRRTRKKQMTDTIKKSFTIKKAQDFLDNLTCKI